MADRAGLTAGDVLPSIDEVPLRSARDLRRALRSLGDVARLGDREVTVDRRPCLPGVEYGTLQRDVRLRTLIRGSGPLGVLFLQGISLSSIEDPSPVSDTLHAIRDVTLMEFERRGIGDSEGEPPDFLTELEDAREALQQLSTRCRHVVLFGHSVGGMIAPLLGEVAGVIVYGTSSRRWRACLEDSMTRQLRLRGVTDIEPILAREREKIDRGDDERSTAFHNQLDAIDLADAWRKHRAPRLVLQGEYDWVVSEEEARAIDPNAIVIPSLDHAMTAHDTLRASIKALGRGRRVEIPEIAEFLGEVRRATASM